MSLSRRVTVALTQENSVRNFQSLSNAFAGTVSCSCTLNGRPDNGFVSCISPKGSLPSTESYTLPQVDRQVHRSTLGLHSPKLAIQIHEFKYTNELPTSYQQATGRAARLLASPDYKLTATDYRSAEHQANRNVPNVQSNIRRVLRRVHRRTSGPLGN